MSDRAELARCYGIEDEEYLDFMVRVDDVVSAANPAGLGVLDFADAMWADLFDDAGPDCSDEAIRETLAEADDIFARMQELV